MAIQKLRRISVHPWVALVILRRALHAHTQTDLSRDSRRRMAVLDAIFSEAFDPEDGDYADPFQRVAKYALDAQDRKNCDLELEFGRAARTMADKGYGPLPKPDLRTVIDVSPEDLKVLEAAVDAYAKSPIGRQFDRGFAAAFDALDSAQTVEVDTAAARQRSP